MEMKFSCNSENQHLLLASLTLLDATSGTQADLVCCGDGKRVTVLEGKLVSQRTTACDLDGSARSFFVFPDVSVRVDGQFRLMVSVVVLDPLIAVLDPQKRAGTVVASGLTDVFTVFDATPSVPPVDALTALTLHLRSQGISI
ncbi:hypothetical protein BC937DRAFT_86308 [Endogone sp. FLAS-F59071]|nr:hypothetical protein BC937DRAFT_86308 [Endogone sp. FLAS-F59071]|eukprot:RUS20133.1 hypothetical protein BC937DRAFT_86308 [Endogone sp. FLAS-F59071]